MYDLDALIVKRCYVSVCVLVYMKWPALIQQLQLSTVLFKSSQNVEKHLS